MSLVTEFREFVLRGNVVDLVVGVAIGSTFNGLVSSLTRAITSPLLVAIHQMRPSAASVGEVSLPNGGANPLTSDFISTLLSFVLTALVVFFCVVKPMNYLAARMKTTEPIIETTQECPFCLSHVPIKATRCAFCTSHLTTASDEAPAVETSTSSPTSSAITVNAPDEPVPVAHVPEDEVNLPKYSPPGPLALRQRQ